MGPRGAVDSRLRPTRIRHWKIDSKSAVFPIFWFCASPFRTVRWRIPIRWYAVVLFGIPAIGVCEALIASRFSQSGILEYFTADHSQSLSFSYLTTALIGELLGGPIGKEPGWRGYALPELLERYRPFPSSLILGGIWAGWHLPLFFLPGVAQYHMSFAIFGVNVLAISVLITWVFIHARQSILIAILMHLLFDLTVNSHHLTIVALINSIAAGAVVTLGGLSIPLAERRAP
jgi:membrane protease YdiL (CAAX protease family)